MANMGGGGLVSGGASGIGGLIYGNPGYNSATVDQGTQNLIQSQGAQAASGTPSQYAANDLQGTNQSVDTTAAQHRSSALGGASDPNMAAALQQRANTQMSAGVNQLQRRAQVTAVGQNATQQQNAFGDVTSQQNAMNQANAAQMQAAQNNAATRSSIVSGLFGAAGVGAGTMGGGNGSLSGSGGNAFGTQSSWNSDGSTPGVSQTQGTGYEGNVDLNY